MTFIQNVMNSLYSESALARRERRLIDRLIVDETALNDAQKELEAICGKKVIDVTQMKRVETKINELVVKITAELKDLLAKENVELQKEVKAPQENLSHVLIAVEKYLKYLISEKTISIQTSQRFKRLLEEIKREFLGLEVVLEKVIAQSQTLFTSIHQEKGTGGFENVDFNKFLAAGDSFEKNKIALSRTIKSLYKKLHNLEKELRKEINRYHRERKKTVKYTIADLCKKQRQAIVAAHRLLVLKGTNTPLVERDQGKIRGYILEALQLEIKIINEMNVLGIPAKLDQAVREQTGIAKKHFQTLVNKLKYYKTDSGVYPFEFWLGEKRALGFLKVNDPKNLEWLKTLLEEGLLHGQHGMLSERDSGIETLIAEGFLNTAHDEFLVYLEEYQKGFLEVVTSIVKRAEISKQVFAILASAMYHTEKVIEQTRKITDAALKKAEEQAKGREDKPKVIINWDKIRAQEEATAEREKQRIQQEAGETMAALATTRSMEQRSRARGSFFMQKAVAALVLVAAQLIPMATQSLASNQEIIERKAVIVMQQQEEVRQQIAEKKAEYDIDSITDKIGKDANPVAVLYNLSEGEMKTLYGESRMKLAWTLKGLNPLEVKKINPEIERIYQKMQQGQKVTDSEISFVRKFYLLLAVAGKAVGNTEASQLLYHYVEGTGKNIQIDSEIYSSSEVVKIAQEKMMQYVLQKVAQGKLPAKGKITSADVFTQKQGFEGDYDSYGGVVKGEKGDQKMYLIAEQGNARLKNANNRFILNLSYTVNMNAGKVDVNWSVLDDYSFENSDYKTVLSFPGGELVLRDRLGFYLTKFAGAKVFMHEASWSSVVSLPQT